MPAPTAPQSSIVLYQTEDGRTRIQCRFDNETIWLTQALIAELFQVTVPTVNEHLKGIYDDGELAAEATIRKFRIVRIEGARQVTRDLEHYSLPAILAVGFRVRSHRGTQFRQWATARLSEYLVKGFTMDDERLKNPLGPGHTDYFTELLERIRDIRASERRMYLRVREILALNEAETRAEHIDPALAAAGWGVVDGSKISREFPITPGRIEGLGRRGKPVIADYVLVYRNHKLAIVEAKAWDKPVTEGLGQAKDYAGKLALRFAYSTNGQGIYGIDMDTGREGDVPRYPTPDELWAQTFAEANAWRDRFAAVPFEDKGGSHPSRYYQDIAVERVLEAITENRQRMLLTLATGNRRFAAEIACLLAKLVRITRFVRSA